MNEPTDWTLLLSLAWLTMGGLSAFCLIRVVNTRRLARRGIRVAGRVVKHKLVHPDGTDLGRGGGSGGSTHYDIVIEFEHEGRQHQTRPALTSNLNLYRKGESVSVCFLPENPTAARVIDLREDLLWGTLGLVTLAIPSVLSYIALVMTGR